MNHHDTDNTRFLQRLSQSLGKAKAVPLQAAQSSNSPEINEAISNMIEFSKPWRPWRLGG